MSTYILIHGAWLGGWCWKKVVPLLESSGHKVIAPDLPGHGSNKIPIANVSLKAYTDYIGGILDKEPEPVILVGHSMGGCVISQVAEYRSDNIKLLVYLSAVMLKNGQSVLQVLMEDTKSVLPQNMEPSEDRLYATVKKESIGTVFFENLTEEEINEVRLLLVPQATSPNGMPITITDQNYGKIPKVYIECLSDRIITLSCQRKMHSEFTCQKVLSLNSDHFPFASSTEDLVEKLLSLA